MGRLGGYAAIMTKRTAQKYAIPALLIAILGNTLIPSRDGGNGLRLERAWQFGQRDRSGRGQGGGDVERDSARVALR
jgi:hypothetical protein